MTMRRDTPLDQRWLAVGQEEKRGFKHSSRYMLPHLVPASPSSSLTMSEQIESAFTTRHEAPERLC